MTSTALFPDFTAPTASDPVDHNNRDVCNAPAICPFTVVIDTREQAPFTFRGLRNDSDRKYRPLVVRSVVQGLPTGDYSIEGFEHRISVERKSLPDAFSTFTTDRERFERELVRLNFMDFGAVVIEAGWDALIDGPERIDRTEQHRRVIGKTVYRSILAWAQRFPRVHWFPMPTRQEAEHTTFRLLERWWEDEKWKLRKRDF